MKMFLMAMAVFLAGCSVVFVTPHGAEDNAAYVTGRVIASATSCPENGTSLNGVKTCREG
jgi:hypothetical protein